MFTLLYTFVVCLIGNKSLPYQVHLSLHQPLSTYEPLQHYCYVLLYEEGSAHTERQINI